MFKHLKLTRKKLVVVGLIIVAFFGGWILKKMIPDNHYIKPTVLRVNNFKFAKPLLVCNSQPESAYPELTPLKNKLNDLINSEKQAGNVNDVSIYYQDFNSDGRLDINKDEKFHPASMGKVPVMLGIYRLAESDSQILSQTIKIPDNMDENAGQEIKPSDYAHPGSSYTVEQLMEKMIKYSDNNSLDALLDYVKPAVFMQLYQDLGITLPYDFEKPENFDYITTRDISYFFRILYNSTYLTNDQSDKALEILSQSDFKDGLVAGVPSGIAVAHKFGIERIISGDNYSGRELHDCGIVYHPTNPYLLCVMTKSSAPDVSSIETAIKDISAAVWDFQNKR